MINGISFHISEEVIALVTGLAMKGRKWKKVTRVIDDVSLQRFFAATHFFVRVFGP